MNRRTRIRQWLSTMAGVGISTQYRNVLADGIMDEIDRLEAENAELRSKLVFLGGADYSDVKRVPHGLHEGQTIDVIKTKDGQPTVICWNGKPYRLQVEVKKGDWKP